MAADRDDAELQIEALVIASPRPLPLDRIREIYGRTRTDDAVNRLSAWWEGRGMTIQLRDDHISLVPSREAVQLLAAADSRGRRRLTEAAVETLSYIAFNQPVTIPDIEKARGVALSKGLIDSLLDAGYVRASLRKTNSGRAVMYVTTDLFLEHYGLGSLADLPTPDEMEDFGRPPSDGHSANDVPQPQEEVALGLTTTNFSPASVDVQSN
jgi:segregation and condensation protein B